jgi:hypothetical protein
MDKIMKALLEAKYPTLNADTLLEIASMTPNPRLAVEKLCGIYDALALPYIGEQRYTKNLVVRTATQIDEWNELVHYNYEADKKISFYVHNDVDTKLVTYENHTEYKREYKSGVTKWMELATGDMEIRNSSCSIGEWLTLTPMDADPCNSDYHLPA